MVKAKIVHIYADTYNDQVIRTLKDIGYTEDTQKATSSEAGKYAEGLAAIYPHVVIVNFYDGHYGLWVPT